MKSISLKTFNAVICMLTVCIIGAGCASTNSNGRVYKDTTSIQVVPVEPAIKLAGAVDIAVEAAVAVTKYAIKSEAKKYESTSEASLLWTGGIAATNPVLIAVIRTFDKNADFETESVGQMTNTLALEINNRLANFDYALPKKLTSQFLTNIVASHKLDSKVSFIALMLAYPGEGKVMYCDLLGYSYPVAKAKNSPIKIPFTDWHSTKSVFTLSIEGAQGTVAAYKAQRVVGPKTLIWPRGQTNMVAWKPQPYPEHDKLIHQAPGIRSVPYLFPQGPVEITATLVESSDMKKNLETLGDRVGKLKFSDFSK